MEKPVFRHMREQAWRQGGALNRLIERIRNMHVLPDVVPKITPTVDLEVLFGSGRGIGDHGGQRGSVHPGVFLDPSTTLHAPDIRATVFHADTRKYTLMLVDPDVPSEETQSFQTYVHWLVSDIPLSIHASSIPEGHPVALPYIPPHPARGTPYHRYTMLLFEQSADTPTPVSDTSRIVPSVSEYAEMQQLKLSGIHFWREEWSASCERVVSHIYEDILRVPEPRFGRPPRTDKLRDDLGERHSKYY